jgi:glycosyltransferase involved in cell wall biosynthesis
LRREHGQVKFLFFGLIRVYKGIDELAAAFSSLIDEGERVHLTVAGEGWDDVESALRTIRNTGEDNYEIISGYIPDNQVKDLFEQADILVAPHRRASASGSINLAMATGLPIVTTKVPALQEACQDYEGVFFAEVEDPIGLREAMRRSMTKVGCHFDNPHSWDANADRYADFFRRIDQNAARDRTKRSKAGRVQRSWSRSI